MSKKIKLKSEEYHQMLDRISVISSIVDNNLQQHPVAKIHPSIKDHISAAVDELYKAAELVKKNC